LVLEDIMELDLLHDYGPVISNPRGSLLSIRDGAPYDAQSLKELYTQVITDVLISCQDFSSVFNRLSDDLKSSERNYAPIFVGPMNETSPMLATLQARFSQSPVAYVDLKQASLYPRPSCSPFRKDKIAIVGMSGRFPGGQDPEEFWKVLYNGWDMHREVKDLYFFVKPICS
jgi:naphtho-gamma-pyrone polyketide synthase